MTRTVRSLCWLVWMVAAGCVTAIQAQQVFISEIVADNVNSATDEDGDHPDWVELFNASTGTVSLNGWYLTDSAGDLRKWKFPNISLSSGARRVVFCSNKDRRNPSTPLHTNFRLNNDGEYLALVHTNGGTIVHEYAPAFPRLANDLAYGLPGDPGWQKLVVQAASARAFVPTAANTNWFWQAAFDDSPWRDVTQGIGYDTSGSYTGLLGFAGNFQFDMYTKRAQVWLREKFTVTTTNGITGLRLQLKYDDGIAVWINGKLVYQDNTPADFAWTNVAPVARADGLNGSWTTVTLPGAETNLINGVNLLAIQEFNVSAGDNDALALCELEAYMASVGSNQPASFLYTPTPGGANTPGSAYVGPFLNYISNNPARPSGTGGPPMIVYANVQTSLNPVTSVKLYYRHMYSNEVMLTMSPSGTTGLYTAQIPVSNMAPGQMVRWRIVATDSSNNTSTVPPFLDPLQNDQYYGTVSEDYVTNSLVPLVHWFRTNTSQAISLTGERCCYYYLGRFYDNVFINQHGQSTAGFAKKSVNVDFNSDNRFHWKDGEEDLKDVNFMSNYADKTRTRNTLAWHFNYRCGTSYFFAFPIRIHMNGAYYGLFDIMEDSDNRWLDRIGYDGEGGALYKVYDSLTSVANAERKTRQWEDKSDLQTLIDNLNTSIALSDRRRWVYDNVDLARCANYFATLDIVSSQDHGHKNFFVYRDTAGTGEWMLLPWDEDLSFGHNWVSGPGYFDDTIYTNNIIQYGTWSGNRFYNVLFSAPEMNQMRLRRLRTLIDTVLMTNGTPTNALVAEAKINEILNQIDPPGMGTNSDAYLDYSKWHTANATTNLTGTGGWGYLTNRQARQEADRVLYQHLPGRRDYLTSTNAVVLGYRVPPSQPPHMPLQFGTYDIKPNVSSQEYFSIVNTNSIWVDISGWRVTGAVTYTFREGTVIPAGGGTNENIGNLFVAKSPKAFRQRVSAPTALQYCFVQGPYDGWLSSRGGSLYLVDDTGAQISSVTWSNTAPSELNNVRVTEIMYNPAPPTLAESNAIPYVLAQDFEYIEVLNLASSNTVFLNDRVRFTEGVEYVGATFPLISNYMVYVSHSNAFLLRYGSNLAKYIAGVYTGYLDNAGERIELRQNTGEVILNFSYNNTWYPSTDGHGFSLVFRDPKTTSWDSWGDKTNWRPSGVIGGTPGAAEATPTNILPVLINEALTHTDLPQVDAIELVNTNATPVDVSNWWLTDDFLDPRKYRMPTNSVIAANGYLTVDESQFNFPTNSPTAFRLSSTGDDVWLFSADASSNLTGYVASRTFGAAQNGVSFGEHMNRAGEEFFVAQSANSLGLTNAYPRVGPAVISEIMYHPPDFTSILATNDNDRDEFIELANISGSTLPLYDTSFPTNTWRLRNAVDYDFPAGVSLPANGRLLVVGFDPSVATNAAAFRAAYGLSTNVPLYGPWSGKLDNSGENIELKRPDAPNSNAVPYILVEDVTYNDRVPWPAQADGQGYSLARIELSAFGNDPYNWYPAGPTPQAAEPLTQDSDGDGFADWAEYYAGTDITNGLSFLSVLSVSTAPGGQMIQWSSVSGKTYSLQVATNLLDPAAFSTLQTGLPASAPLGVWTDPAGTNAGPRLYRIRVEP